MLMLDVYDKPFDYLLQVENEYNKIVEKYKIRNEYYFNALRELKNKYNRQYDALTTKSNLLIYGNPEGKVDRKNRDRSDLYIKVLRRSQKYKNWKNFFTAIGVAALFILIVKSLFGLFFKSCFISNSFELFTYVFTFIISYVSVSFDFLFYFKSLKYSSCYPKNTRAEKIWLKKYVRSIKDIIRAKNYLEVLVEKEEAIEKFINTSDVYLKALDTISKMRKDVENAMYKTNVPDVVNTLNNILKQWKTYYGGNKI
ncbi:MAG: hypothetical protein SOY54_07285 [Bacilli bacterium]|nr:hypothetical protein [Bacilli bacterium]